MHELFTPLLVGENALHTRYLWEKLFQATLDSEGEPKSGLNPAAVRGALCAVDLALWDIKAKAANVSVCELLGGKPHPVPAYIQKGFYVPGESLNKMADEAVRGLEAGGYRYLKMRIGRNGTREARERVSVMREALGDDIGLMVDVNQAWHLDEAVEGAKALEPYNLTWYEEPIARKPQTGSPSQSAENFDWNGELGELAGRISIPLAAGENHKGLYECNELIVKAKPKYMQLDLIKMSGGLSEWIKVASICQANGILMAPHHAAHFHVQVVAAVSHGFIVECCDNEKQHPSWPDLFIGFPEVKEGFMECPAEPGWGLEINDEMIKRYGTALDWDF